MAERQFGPYRLVRQIAVGGMAEIHLAKTKGIAGFEKYVALKMIHPNYAADEQFIQMLVDEAKIAVQLTHGNIAQTFDLGRVGETYYITMEYVDGADLYKILRRGSETDVEMPLDVCAFIAKEIASALDHAHRKRDHSGKTLGIVHRDVSPQNVLVSYSGEVKLVDFGIAKATMKAKHTAVGVIKGKYYYMSPEQAWGDQIDYRSDIFSAGIVLYEMITGQMLYLEEDLQRLLEMVRNADIAPPSTLRRGVPPQLEHIVMHALAKDRRDRYQSASDFATDLERFLHSYSPVFTAAKVANLMKQIIGEPAGLPESTGDIEHRDGPTSTHNLTSDDLIQDKEELERDENSVIFRVADLRPKKKSDPPKEQQQPQRVKQPTGAVPAGPRVTRQADINDIAPPKPAPLPSMPKPAAKPAKAQSQSKPRDANEVTREVQPIAKSPTTDDSGLLGLDGPGPASTAIAWKKHDGHGTMPGVDSEAGEGIGEHTMISGAPAAFGGFMMDNAGEDSVDATQISTAPLPADDTNPNVDPFGGGTFSGETHDDVKKRESSGDVETAEDVETADDNEALEGEDGPTIQRDWRENQKPKVSARAVAPPPALAAKIHAPAVSELRKPRASRRTPGAGLPAQANLLQQIVSSKPSEPMPAPRAGSSTTDDSGALTLPDRPGPAVSQEPVRNAMQQSTILGQKSPLAGRTGPQPITPGRVTASTPSQPVPSTHGSGQMPQVSPQGAPPGVQSTLPPPPGQPVGAYPPGYPQQQYPGYPQGGYPGYSGPPQQPVSPGALYQLQPYGAPPPQPMTVTSQLRLWEADELGDKYKLNKGAPRWLMMVIASVIAISIAAGVTFFIIKATRDSAPQSATVRVASDPPGAEVLFDGVRMAGTTPLTVDGVPTATRHDVRVELPRYEAYTETIDIPKKGGEVAVNATLKRALGKLSVITHPENAQIRIDGRLVGMSNKTIDGLDTEAAKKLEVRLDGYAPVLIDLDWSDKVYIQKDIKLVKN